MKPAYGKITTELINKIGQLGLFFTHKDIYLVFRELDISLSRGKNLINLFVGCGLLQRVKLGTYTLTSNFHGGQDTHPFLIAMKLLPGCIISGWSALNYHELTEQIPRSIFLTNHGSHHFVNSKTTIDSCTKKIGLNVFVIFSTVTQDRLFGVQNVCGFEKIGRREERFQIFDKERSVLDCFVFPKKFGGLSTGLGILEEHLHRLDIGKLVQYAINYGSLIVCKRLGWSLEEVGASEIQYAPLLEHTGKMYQVLDPISAPIGKCNSRWKIRNNLIKGIVK